MVFGMLRRMSMRGTLFVAWNMGILSAVLLLSTPTAAAPAKNVILMIGDGMGLEQVKAAGMYLNGAAGTLNFESFPNQAMMTTASANSWVTDSAAAGTAIATGVKVNNDVVSLAIPGDGSELPTMLELFKDQGKRTGLVTTTGITHATPATFGAHETSRSNRVAIGKDFLNQSRPNVLFGSGDQGLNRTLINNDGSYMLVENNAELGALTNNEPYVAGLFGSIDMAYEYDYAMGWIDDYDTTPHLSETTDAALDLLDSDPDGFFLMVEGGRIDHAGHSSNYNQTLKTGRNIYETVEFAAAVQKVIDWANTNDPGLTETLILVTADHETGGLLVTENNPTAGTLPSVTWSSNTYHTGVNVPLAAIGVHSELISGVMDNTDLLAVVMEATLDGDFDEDGDVDGADFLAWQRGNSTNPLSSSDLIDWQANFGNEASPIYTASTAVPEPSTVAMLLLGVFLLQRRGLRRKSDSSKPEGVGRLLNGGLIPTAVLLLGLAGSASAATTIDDFESYANTAALRGTWNGLENWGGFNRNLNATGGVGTTRGMSLSGTASRATGGWAKREVAVDMSGDTAIRFWQQTTVGTNTDLEDVVYRFVVKIGGSRYYQTESYTPIGGGTTATSTALSVTGPWGAGGSGGYIDLPLAGGGDSSGDDDWYWFQTQGTPAPIDWSNVTRIQILGYAYDSGNGTSFSTVYDNLQGIPEPASAGLLGFGALALLCRRRR